MTALVPYSFSGDVFPPDEGVVHVTGFLNFLKRDRITATVPCGGTISEIIDEVTVGHARTGISFCLAVYVNDVPVPEAWWPRVRPRNGTHLSFVPRLQGDNVGALLGIAVMVAAMVIAPWAVGAIGLTGMMATVGQAVIGGAIMFGGMMAINAIFPIRPPELEPNEESGNSIHSLSTGSNRIAKYEPIPAPLGRHRYFPPFGASPYTETVGDDQYLRVLVVWGIGPIQVSDIRIGETPLNEFSDYEIENREGYDDDDNITLIPRDVHEETLNIELEADTGDDPIRFTQLDADEVSVDVVAPAGIFRINQDTGDKQQHQVEVEFYYRLADSSDPWVLFASVIFLREPEAARKGRNFKLPERGQYEIKANKIAGAEADHIMDTVVWSVLRSITHERPVTPPVPLAMTALRIKATEQISGTLQTINGIVRPLIKAYNGTEWENNQVSQSPADIYRHVLQGAAQGRPKLNSEIDLDTLEEWWDFCRRRGYKFNQVRDGVAGTWDVLADVCAAGCAVPIHKDGKWSVSWDRDDDVVRQHFTPRNAWGLSFRKDFFEEVHAWRIPFINEDRSWSQDERTVYDDGYNAGNATKFAQIEFPGVTDPQQIWKLGRRHIAQIRLRPDTISFSTDWEALVCTRGDRVYLAYDTLRIGQVSAYVKNSGIDGGVEWIEVDEILVLEGGKNYAARFRKASNGESVLRSVISGAGQTKRINLVGSDELPSPGDLLSFGETDLVVGVFRVKEIENQENLFAKVSVVDDAPGVADAETGEIPEYESHISDPVNYYSVAPTGLVVTEMLESRGPTAGSVAKLSWQMIRMATVDRFQIQVRDDDANGDWRNVAAVLPPQTWANVPLEAAGNWSFRVRALFDSGASPSAWAESSSIPMLGLLAAPASVMALRSTFVSGNSVLDWDEVVDPRGVYYEVRRGGTADVAMTVMDQLRQPRYATVGDGTYWVAAYVLGPFGDRIYSASWASAVLVDSVLVKNIILEVDESGDGFLGLLDGGVVSAGIIATDGTAIADAWAVAMLEEVGVTEEVYARLFAYQSDEVVDVGRVVSCLLSITWDAAGATIGASFLDIASLFEPPYEDLLGEGASRYVRILPVIRTADVEDEWGDWTPFSPGAYRGRYFQAGLVGYSVNPTIDAVCPTFRWAVDVPDRVDHYTDLTVPAAGYSLVFRPDNEASAPFNGGPNGSTVPHISSVVINPTLGDEVRITDLTATGCTVKVHNAAGTAVERSGVNVKATGY